MHNMTWLRLGFLILYLFFLGMADFQCLAVHSQNGKQTSLYDKIILRESKNQEFFEQPMPYFLPPAIFSRLDNPVDYFYRPDVFQKSVKSKQYYQECL